MTTIAKHRRPKFRWQRHTRGGRIYSWTVSSCGTVVLVAFVCLALFGCGSKASAATDPGVQACQMMAADKASGLTPDDSRSAQEVTLLTDSHNADLHRAGIRLASYDTDVQLKAIGDLYTGCAAVGVHLN